LITRQVVADKIVDYLHGKLSQAELVDWAERAMMDADFNETDTDLLSDIVGRLGLADVAEFGLRWQDCKEFLRRLGYPRKGDCLQRIIRGAVAVATPFRLPAETSLSGEHARLACCVRCLAEQFFCSSGL
jgi:hypothetical protein